VSARRKVAAAVGVAAVAGAAVALSQYVPPNERGRGAVAAGDLSGSLVGAGASSQQAAMQGWTAGYSAVQPGVTVDYDPVGSGGGREQFVAGGIDFAGSDAPLDEEELVAARQRCGGEVFELPNYISPIAVVHNLPGVEDLALSPTTLARVFAGQVTRWDDPAIAADNPGVALPALPITPVNRSDESGTTENFTEYLAAAAPGDWPFEPEGEWPVEGGESAQGNSGVIAAVAGGEGTVGYADLSQAGDLGVARIGVGGEFVPPTPEAAAAVVEGSEPLPGRGPYDFALELERTTAESGSYPIVLVSYHLGCIAYEDPLTADLVADFMTYVTSEEGQAAAAEVAGSAPISDALREEARTAIDAISTAP
jgi:phosphate transport system substrate-binding protein